MLKMPLVVDLGIGMVCVCCCCTLCVVTGTQPGDTHTHTHRLTQIRELCWEKIASACYYHRRDRFGFHHGCFVLSSGAPSPHLPAHFGEVRNGAARLPVSRSVRCLTMKHISCEAFKGGFTGNAWDEGKQAYKHCISRIHPSWESEDIR